MNPLVITALNLRKSVGLTNVLLPIVLLVGAGAQDSFSAYYWTGQRDTFVGALAVTGAYLMAYQGYDWRDRTTSRLAAVAAWLVAWFPTAPAAGATAQQRLEGAVHGGSALVLFLCLAYFCLRLFVLTSGEMTPKKLWRNRVYKACGCTILACVAVSAVGVAAGEALGPAVFWAEALAVWAFGWSWAVKGEALLADDLRAPAVV